MRREPAQTIPPTFTSLEVSAIFHGGLTVSSLQDLDRRGLLRPTFYYDSEAPGGLITQSERDSRLAAAGSGEADPHRRYTYTDIVWMRLFLRVKTAFLSAKVANATRRAAEVIVSIRSRAGGACPPAWRLVIFGKELYLVKDDMTAESFARPGQLGLVQLFETVHAEVRGRVTALAEHKKIRTLELKSVGMEALVPQGGKAGTQ
jgi:hypothetical protein